MWHDYIHLAIAENHPNAYVTAAYLWAMGENGEPFMQWWDEDKLGPLDLAAIQARCEELMQIPATPPEISDRQFFDGLRKRGIISDAEFLSAVSVGAIPQAMQDIMDTPQFQAALDQIGMDLISAKGLIMGARTFEYDSPLTPMFAQAFGWTMEQARQFWIECASY